MPIFASNEERMQWLVDRAEISDLLVDFAHALDTRDWKRYCDNYADGGYIEIPDPIKGNSFRIQKEQMMDLVPGGMAHYLGTHHVSSNHRIELNGDTARSRSYVTAVSTTEQPTNHWKIGGWYDNEYVRQDGRWLFKAVHIHVVWLEGEFQRVRPASA
jgi:SnoaL-like domain